MLVPMTGSPSNYVLKWIHQVNGKTGQKEALTFQTIYRYIINWHALLFKDKQALKDRAKIDQQDCPPQASN